MNPERFSEIAPQWQDLISDRSDPFSDHAWFQCWWGAFGGGTRLQVCAVWRGNTLAAALPLHGTKGRLLPLANYHTPIFRPPGSVPDALVAAFAAALESAPARLHLHAVPVDDSSVAIIKALSARRRRFVLEESQYTSPIVDISGDIEAYQRLRRSKLRTLLRRRRKLWRERDVEFRFADTFTDLSAELHRGFGVEGSGWKTERGTAISSSERTVRFYMDLAEVYRDRGELRLAWLIVDEQPAAFAFLLLRHGHLYLLKTGYEPRLREYTPGLILNLNIIEACFDRGYVAYELLGDRDPWKLQFATSERSHERVYSYAARPKPVVEYVARRVGRPLVQAARERMREARSASGQTSAARGGHRGKRDGRF